MNCKICGSEIGTGYFPKTLEVLANKQMCFTCDYWDIRVNNQNSLRQVVIDGVVYQPESDRPYSKNTRLHGFFGRRFAWKWLDDGREPQIVTTNNMWFNGEPKHKHFKSLLKDNAVWATEEEKALAVSFTHVVCQEQTAGKEG